MTENEHISFGRIDFALETLTTSTTQIEVSQDNANTEEYSPLCLQIASITFLFLALSTLIFLQMRLNSSKYK